MHNDIGYNIIFDTERMKTYQMSNIRKVYN